jgi:polyribonucleotide nucleotidyltransferase
MVIDATVPRVVMSKVIGKDGKVFKAITHQSGVEYIWYRNDTHTVEVWGAYHAITGAVTRVQERMRLIRDQEFPGLG